MLKVVRDSTLSAIGDAIRSATLTSEKLLPTEMPSAIERYTVGFDQIAQKLPLYVRGMASSIAQSAFAGLSETVVGIDYPNCTTVGSSAFFNCQSLSEVSLPRCKSVGTAAFASCRSLTVVSLPECETLSNKAFISCANLTEVHAPNIMTIGTNTVDTSADGAFEGCTKLSVADVGAPIEILGRTFYGCTALSSICLESCETIGAHAFVSTKIANSSLPRCTTLGANCFTGCSMITSMTMPVCSIIGSSAFYGCSRLSMVSAPVVSIGYNAFYSCSALVSIDTANVTTLGSQAFYGCRNVTQYDLGRVEAIPSYCFVMNTALMTVSLPVATYINRYAFRSCTGMSTAFLMGNLTTISSSAFLDCSKLESVYVMRPDSTVTLGSRAFDGTPMSKSTLTGIYGSIYVPDNLYSYYMLSTYWSSYGARLVSVPVISASAYNPFPNDMVAFGGLSGVDIVAWSASNGVASVTCVERSAGHEGFNIILSTCEPNVLHEVEFDFRFTDAQFIGTSYRCGWFLTQGVKSDYTSYSTWPENLPRDSDTHHQMWRITPSGETFFATFCLDGLSDSYENHFEITNLTARTATWDM